MITEIAVVVPVANEADHLGRCLEHIAAARTKVLHSSPGIVVRVVVVLDDCRDASEQIAAGAAGVEIVRIAAHSVGSARRAGADHVLRGSSAPERIWLANTDADTYVPSHWLSGMLEQAVSGTQVLLGTVTPGPGLRPAIAAAWHAAHLLVEGHPHVHGANFGIRGDVYLRLGGWPELVHSEDVALAARAEAESDVRIVSTARLPVLTSVRLHARAPHGLSSYLRGLASGDPVHAELT